MLVPRSQIRVSDMGRVGRALGLWQEGLLGADPRTAELEGKERKRKGALLLLCFYLALRFSGLGRPWELGSGAVGGGGGGE